MWSAIRRLLSEQLGPAEITERSELPGGDVHPTWYLRYGEHEIFVKCNQRDMQDLFTWEADQLQLLARSQTVRVPAVYGVGSDRDTSFLLLEYIPVRPLDAHGAFQLGQQLAHLHQWSEQPQFGLDFDNNITTSLQPNSWLRRWSVFFAEQRIGWQLQLAAEKGIQYGDSELIVHCAQAILESHHPQPSLLHGDLWPANCAGSDSGPWIFDPACYWGIVNAIWRCCPGSRMFRCRFMMVTSQSGRCLATSCNGSLSISSITCLTAPMSLADAGWERRNGPQAHCWIPMSG
ncbi:hypothetical protein ERHA55_23250 [Erwinia rhapontici]|nr:hypothetical protein ERHA55_23250 [Erwinia rhapontici]